MTMGISIEDTCSAKYWRDVDPLLIRMKVFGYLTLGHSLSLSTFQAFPPPQFHSYKAASLSFIQFSILSLLICWALLHCFFCHSNNYFLLLFSYLFFVFSIFSLFYFSFSLSFLVSLEIGISRVNCIVTTLSFCCSSKRLSKRGSILFNILWMVFCGELSEK